MTLQPENDYTRSFDLTKIQRQLISDVDDSMEIEQEVAAATIDIRNHICITVQAVPNKQIFSV